MGKIHDYKANYSKYLILRKERRETQLAAAKNQQREIEKTPELSEVRVVAAKAKAPEAEPAKAVKPVKAEAGMDAVNAAAKSMQSDAPACNTCGHITIRSGTCYKCLNCGTSMGCS